MPLQFYVPVRAPCRLCGPGFEHHAATAAAPLTDCPTCGQRVQRRAMQSVSSPKLSGRRSVSMAKQAGFAVLKRNSDGRFEKQ